MKGRRPSPTALKLLQGNPGHRPIGDVMTREPQPNRTGFRNPPAHITGEAAKFWYAQGPELVQMGTLTDADWPVFEDLCLLHEEKLALTRRINRHRSKRRPTPKDEMILMTLEGRRRKAMVQFTKVAGEFGATAASRPRVRLSSGQGEFPFAPTQNESALDTSRRQLTGA
jgi:phage terminase small subunit